MTWISTIGCSVGASRTTWSRRLVTKRSRRSDIPATKRSSFSSSTSSKPIEDETSGFFAWYARKLDTHPLLTKGITSGIISGVADVLCQLLVKDNHIAGGEGGLSNDGNGTQKALSLDDGKQLITTASTTELSSWQWDVHRTTRFFIMGTLFVAPITHAWYNALSKRILPGSPTVWKTVQRVALDQVGFAPIFVTGFMTCLWMLEDYGGLAKQEIKDKNDNNDRIPIPTRLMDNIPEMVVANWSLWVPAMAINFSIIPIKYQVLYSNVIALLWNVYVSFKSVSYSQSSSSSSINEE